MPAGRFGSLIRFITFTLTGVLPSAALAQVSPDIVKAASGTFLIATDDGKPGCRIGLTTTRIKGDRYKAAPAQDCAANLPKLAAAAAWEVSSGTKLYDGAGKLLIHFEEDETTFQKTRDGKAPVTMLVQAKPGVDHAPSVAGLTGTWVFKRPNGPDLCEVTFSDKIAGEDESRVLATAQNCDKALASLKLKSWTVEDFALMLYGGPEKSLRLEPVVEGFEKAPGQGGKPLLLIKK